MLVHDILYRAARTAILFVRLSGWSRSDFDRHRASSCEQTYTIRTVLTVACGVYNCILGSPSLLARCLFRAVSCFLRRISVDLYWYDAND